MIRKNIKFVTFIIALLIISSLFAVFAYANNNKYELFKESVYNRALNELIDYMNDINANLSKIEYIDSPTELTTMTSILNGAVNSAKSCLGQLPLNNVNLDKLQKYLMQTANFTTAISNKKINNDEISDEEYEIIEKLKSYSLELVRQFSLLNDMVRTDGNIVKSMTGASFGDIPEIVSMDNIFVEYPALIYDGPFSDSQEINNYHTLETSHEVDSENAEYNARRFLGKSIKLKSFENNDMNPQIYSYSCGNAYIDITKRGGYILRMGIYQPVSEINLNENEALSACYAFIENQGYNNMKATYYISDEGIMTANYAYVINNAKHGEIICYSDLIKIGVMLNTGKVCFYDADSYLKNHTTRDIPTTIISSDEAANSVNKKLTVKSSRIAIIPKDNGIERLCYEFTCQNGGGESYLVYINAVNGNQENILMILDTGHGTLVV